MRLLMCALQDLNKHWLDIDRDTLGREGGREGGNEQYVRDVREDTDRFGSNDIVSQRVVK